MHSEELCSLQVEFAGVSFTIEYSEYVLVLGWKETKGIFGHVDASSLLHLANSEMKNKEIASCQLVEDKAQGPLVLMS